MPNANEIYIDVATLLNLSEAQLKEISALEYCERQAHIKAELEESFAKAGVSNYWISVDHWGWYDEQCNKDQNAHEWVRQRLISVFSDVYKEWCGSRPRWDSYPATHKELGELIDEYSQREEV